MSDKVKTAVGGTKHDVFQAPEFDYSAAQKVAYTGTAAESDPIDSPLILLMSTTRCFITIGHPDDSPVAANAAGSFPLPAYVPWGESITPGHVVSVVKDTDDGALFIKPVKTEAA